jgi:nitrous oxidase accessory protein NosD
MNEHLDFERVVAGHIGGEGVSPPSDAFYDELITRARRSGQRPEWLALIKESPMRSNSRLAVGSPLLRVAAIMAATLLLAVAAAAGGVAGTRLLANGPIIVAQDGSGTVETITEAVAMAQDGDEIVVKPGTYDESITITKDITLRGEDRDSVIILTTGDALTYDDFWWGSAPYSLLLLDTNAVISDLTFGGGSHDVVAKGGAPSIHDITMNGDNLVVYAGSSATVKDSTLRGSWVHVDEQSPVTIEDSTFRAIVANTDNTPLVGGPATIRGNTTQGIAFSGSALVEGNTLIAGAESMFDDFFGSGIDVQAGEGWLIKDNTVRGFSRGTAIDVPSGAIGTVSGNTLSDNQIAIETASDSVVEGNVVTGGEAGLVTSLGSPTLTGNTITGVSGPGLALDGHPTLSGNSSCDNGENLWVADNATPVIDDSNEICEDAPAVEDE